MASEYKHSESTQNATEGEGKGRVTALAAAQGGASAALPRDAATLATVPTEVVQHVLSYVDLDDVLSAGMACRSTRAAALGAHLWRAIDLSARPGCYGVQDKKLSALLALAAKARAGAGGAGRLDLSGCISVTDAGCRAVAAACPGLRELVVDGTDGFRVRLVTDDGVRDIVQRCTALERLTLRCALSVTDASLVALAASPGAATRLKHLDITGCARIAGGGVAQLRELRGLESLHIAGCRSVPVEALADLFSPALEDGGPASPFPRLHTLTLSHLSASPETIVAMARACGGTLRCLNVQGCGGITDEALAAIGEHAPRLEDFCFGPARELTNDGIARLVEATGDSLRQLHFYVSRRAGSGALCAIAEHCPALEVLVVRGTLASSRGVEALARARCSGRLRRLWLSGQRTCRGITEAALSSLVDACTSLEDLDVFKCANFSVDVAVHALRRCKRLLRMDIRGTPASDDALLHALLAGEGGAGSAPTTAGGDGDAGAPATAGGAATPGTDDDTGGAAPRGHVECPALTELLFSGEACTPALVGRLAEQRPWLRLHDSGSTA